MKNQPVPLLSKTKEILLGSLLGDGSLKIYSGYANARFSFRHSVIQKEYFDWKVKQLQEISSDKSVFLQKNDGGYSQNEKWRYQSRALPQLTEMHTLTYKQGKLRIRRKWLNQLSALSLAIWWCDDGSLISNGRKGVFCTDGFEKKQVETISKYLKSVWSIDTVVAPVKAKQDGTRSEYYRVWIRSTQELQKFLRIILPYIKVESMLQKVLLLYHDDQLQQRWISEVASLTGFSVATVQKAVTAKKSRWRKYQKMI